MSLGTASPSGERRTWNSELLLNNLAPCPTQFLRIKGRIVIIIEFRVLMICKKNMLRFTQARLGEGTDCYLSLKQKKIWPQHTACGILVPPPGIKPTLSALEAWSFNYWATKEVIRRLLYLFKSPQQTLVARALPWQVLFLVQTLLQFSKVGQAVLQARLLRKMQNAVKRETRRASKGLI